MFINKLVKFNVKKIFKIVLYISVCIILYFIYLDVQSELYYENYDQIWLM